MRTCRCDKCGLRWPEEETAPFLLWRHVQHAFAYNPQILCLPCYREFYPNAYREYRELRKRRQRQLDELLARLDEEDAGERVVTTEYHPGLEPPS
jgi:hypothetical protein